MCTKLKNGAQNRVRINIKLFNYEDAEERRRKFSKCALFGPFFFVELKAFDCVWYVVGFVCGCCVE